MKKKIDWLNHALEFFVVLIGILIAFQLNQWATDRKQQKLVDNHINSIITETEFNQNNFSHSLIQAEKNLKKLDTLISTIMQDGSIKEINNRSLQLLNVGGLYIKKNAYNTLVQSGDIRFLNDFKLKSELVNLYEYYTWVEGFNNIILDHYKNKFYPYVSDNFDLIRGTVQAKDIYFSKKYLNLLGTYRYTLNMTIQKYKDCQVVMEDFLEQLK